MPCNLISQQKYDAQLGLEKSRWQEQIKRIKSLKTMAGSITHPFNNTMMVVMGSLEKRKLELILPAEIKEREMAARGWQSANKDTLVERSMLANGIESLAESTGGIGITFGAAPSPF
jgi:hypothetical protein